MKRRFLAVPVASLALLAGCAQGAGPAATPMPDVTTPPTTSAPSAPATTAGPTAGESTADQPTATEPAASPSQSPEPSLAPTSSKTEASAEPSASASESTPSGDSTSEAPKTTFVLAKGQVTGKVRELQARLRQLGHFTGTDVSNVYGPATMKAVKAFQTKRGLEATGNVDQKTWDTLVAATKAPTEDELNNRVAGPSVLGPKDKRVKQLQARLAQVGCYAGKIDGTFPTDGVSCFQKKKNLAVTGQVDQRTWSRLVATTRTPTPYELGEKKAEEPQAGVVAPECAKYDRVICVDMSERKLRWVVDGKIQLTLAARFGNSEAGYPTVPGEFRVWLKAKDYVSKAYKVPMPYSMFFDYEGRAVHYSENFAQVGYRSTSHGCVNVRDLAGIKWLYSQVHQGEHVVIVK